ncbi:phosphoribosylanthranilate isomerase [Methylocaldum sp.]|uniref:phosphoribosylanthranilate isomerase n=1 Tax=Methylocaldum sp. TaxID=1969727 RepID=UPI002D311CA5|nr:phosphoribosylanthranilate isomerase [Methylocaldum sp.]HYE36487.1 phosphoribosylanthranilate isomerase [Methylocaldum sp.]
MKFPYPFRRTRVKICGFTRPDDALTAIRLGADAIGLVFYPQSPRNLDIETARRIVSALPPFATVVGLFVDEDEIVVREVLEQVRIDLIQFHGEETPDYCGCFGKPYIKAVRMRSGMDLATVVNAYPDAAGFLLDAWHADAKGGTGHRFDWELIPKELRQSVVLAGGLAPDNVGEALRTVRPYAVDVSSGVESGKGIKDAGKMAAFLKQVHEYDHTAHID